MLRAFQGAGQVQLAKGHQGKISAGTNMLGAADFQGLYEQRFRLVKPALFDQGCGYIGMKQAHIEKFIHWGHQVQCLSIPMLSLN